MENLTIFTNQFKNYQGQFVIVNSQVFRFIGVAEDDFDYYWIFYNGKDVILNSCLITLIPLKGFIREFDYFTLVNSAKLRHLDQVNLFDTNGSVETLSFNQSHRDEMTNKINANYSILNGLVWEIN